MKAAFSGCSLENKAEVFFNRQQRKSEEPCKPLDIFIQFAGEQRRVSSHQAWQLFSSFVFAL